MEIVRLPPGVEADRDTDCIKIDRLSDGRFSLVTSALVDTDEQEEDEEDSEAVVSSEAYASYDEAEAAGLAWAAGLGVQKLYVETN